MALLFLGGIIDLYGDSFDHLEKKNDSQCWDQIAIPWPPPEEGRSMVVKKTGLICPVIF